MRKKKIAAFAALGLLMLFLSASAWRITRADAAARALEARILRATARLEVDYWQVKPDGSGYVMEEAVAHGTVKDGRYLVTHNHFPLRLAVGHTAREGGSYVRIRVLDAEGRQLATVLGEDVAVVVQEPETLVLDFGMRDGVGFFTSLGLATVRFGGPALPLPEGAELAQVNWDGARAHVQWTRVLAVEAAQGVTFLRLDGSLLAGASGGGVFWEGRHIGTNWATVAGYDEQGRLIAEHNRAALDSARVAEAGGSDLEAARRELEEKCGRGASDLAGATRAPC